MDRVYDVVNKRLRTSDCKAIELANKGKDTHDLLYDLKQESKYYCRLFAPAYSGEDQNCTSAGYKVFTFFKKDDRNRFAPFYLA
jgi:hypothetical protein